MLDQDNHLVKKFGLTQGLYKGGNVAFNLLCHSIIAMTPHLGSNGLLIVIFLTYTISALIEIPTGIFADSVGPYKSMALSFYFRFLGIFLFAIAITIAVLYPQNSIGPWPIFFTGAIVDALSISFLSGSYESAYQKWFDSQKIQNTISRKNLFIQSIKYEWPSFIIILLLVLFQIFAINQMLPQGLYLSYLVILSMFIIKFLQWKKIKNDFIHINIKTNQERTSFTDRLKLIKSNLLLTFSLAYGHTIYRIVSIFFVGQIYYILIDMNLMHKNAWVLGMSICVILHLCIYVCSLFLSKTKHFIGYKQQIYWPIPLLILSFSIVFYYGILWGNIGPFYQLIFILIYIIAIAPLSMILNSSIYSSIQHWNRQINDKSMATWISTANVFAMGFFSFISGVCLLSNTPNISIPMMLFFIIIASLILLVLQLKNKKNIYQASKLNIKDVFLMIMMAILSFFSYCLYLGIYFQIMSYLARPRIKNAIEIAFLLMLFFVLIFILFYQIFLYALSFLVEELKLLINISFIDQMKITSIEKTFNIEELKLLAYQMKIFTQIDRKNTISQTSIKTISMIAHEIKRPFIQIKLYFECLNNCKSMDEFNKIRELLADKLNVHVKEVQYLLEDLVQLNLEKMLCFETVDLKQFLLNTIDKFHHPISFNISWDLKHSYQAIIDTVKFSRVIENIIQNALQAQGENIPNGIIKITTNNIILNTEKRIQISIWNSHSSIADDDFEKIFQLYYSKGKAQGTGIGLALSLKIMKDHNGDLYCKKSTRPGVEMIIIIPAQG